MMVGGFHAGVLRTGEHDRRHCLRIMGEGLHGPRFPGAIAVSHTAQETNMSPNLACAVPMGH